MAHRDFDAARREHDGEPLTFTLGGEEFTVGEVGAMDVCTFAAGVGLPAFRAFLLAVLTSDEDRERLARVLTEHRPKIQPDQLTEIVNWIAEETTGRPTTSSSASPASPSTDGPASRRVSLVSGSSRAG